jgi:hypothetical protein
MEASSSNKIVARGCALFEYPLDVRLEIYRQLLVQRQPIDLLYLDFNPARYGQLGPVSGANTNILLASKQTYTEAIGVLYSDNIFKGYLNMRPNCLRLLPPAHRNRIRHLLLEVRPMDDRYGPSIPRLDDNIWPPLLAQLKQLCIIILEPMEQSNVQSLLERCKVWLQPMLEYISAHKPARLVPEIDCNGLEEMSDLAHECFPDGWREPRLQHIDYNSKTTSSSWR